MPRFERERARLADVRALIAAAVACWGIGCAGPAANVPSTEFRASDLELFDNAVDTVDSPVIVEGEWSGAFERRVGRADLIAVVEVDSLASDLVKRRSAYRITLKVEQRLKGSSSEELVFRVTDEEPGYETVRAHEDRLLHDPFIAFVKWEAQGKSNDPLPRWHLSPDSEAVRSKIEYVLREPAKDPHTEVEVVPP